MSKNEISPQVDFEMSTPADGEETILKAMISLHSSHLRVKKNLLLLPVSQVTTKRMKTLSCL